MDELDLMNNPSQEFKDMVNKNLLDLIGFMMNYSMPFALVVSNKNWAKPLPINVSELNFFFIQINDQTMEDSYMDLEKGCLVVNTRFGDVDNSVNLYPENVRAIFDISMQVPLLNKPYSEDVVFNNLKNNKNKSGVGMIDISNMSEEEKHSLDCFIKNNPNIEIVIK